MSDNQNGTEAKLSDLWYALHEDYSSDEDMRCDLVEYLELSAALAKALPVEYREQHDLDQDIPIAFDNKTGRNIAYSALAVITNAEWIHEDQEPELYEIFVQLATLLTHPRAGNIWNDFFESVDSLNY
jgi:hypothetical protein